MNAAEVEETIAAAPTSETVIEDDIEVVGTLVSVGQGRIVLETRQRFEILMRRTPDSLVSALGKVVGVVIIDGKVEWRLVGAGAGHEGRFTRR